MRIKTIACFLLISCISLFDLCLCSSHTDKYKCVPCTDDAAAVTDISGAQAADALPAGPEWAYMIQNDVTEEIEGTEFNILVMDYTRDGTEDEGQPYTASEMTQIKTGGVDRKAIAYLSIGEAENYRWYFNPDWTDNGEDGQPDSDAPCWLNRTNPDWEGNYKVQYWSEDWQQIILAYIDKIISYGFDGVYLDIIDGFEYWSDPENGEGLVLSEADAAGRMINFVKRIAYHTRVTRSKTGFIVIPQNGEGIIDYDADYLPVINGTGIEDLYYNERTEIDSATADERIGYLNRINAGSRKVLVVDYVFAGSPDSIVTAFRSKVTGKGYFPYAARTGRELDDLVVFTGQGE